MLLFNKISVENIMKFCSFISFALSILGSLLWLVIGLFGINPIAEILGYMSINARLVYISIGLGGAFLLFFLIVLKPLKLIG